MLPQRFLLLILIGSLNLSTMPVRRKLVKSKCKSNGAFLFGKY